MSLIDQKKRYFTIAFILLILLGAGGYSYLKTKDLIAGPQITILSPLDGASLTASTALIQGVAKNITYLSLDDRQIYVDDRGNFSELLALPPGYTILSLKGVDKFGKKKEVAIQLVVQE